MFYVSCKCGSRDVHHYRYKSNSNTLNQFCGSCKTNMTQIAVAKAYKTRCKTRKTALRRTKHPKPSETTYWGYSIALIAILISLYFPATLIRTAYAQMAEPLVYEADHIVQVHEKVDEVVVKPVDNYQFIKNTVQPHGISATAVYELIKYETSGTFDPKQKSNVRYNFSDPKRGIVKGEIEDSKGWCQLHKPDFKGTEAERESPEYCLNFIIKNWSHREMYWRNTITALRAKGVVI
jgi:hypothetical protein